MPVLKVKNGGTWINVSGGSGSSVQSDWTVNDETNPAHIKNRPFYEEPNVWVPLLPSTEFSPFYTSPSFGVQMYDREATYDLIIGETYRITWDGAVYECVAQDINSIMQGGIALGNGSAFGLDGNNEPFIIYIVNGYEGYMSLTDAEAGGSHTVAIEEIGTIIHKVDGKYLPDGIGYTEVITKNETFDIIQIANDFGAEWTTRPGSESLTGKPAIGLGIESEEALINFTVGNEYQVVINGISYTSNAADLSSAFGMPVLAIGDYDSSNFTYMVLAGRTDEGYFAFEAILDAETFNSAPTDFTISGLTNTEIIHKIDSKYLPEDVAFLDDIPEVPSQIVNTVNGMTGDVTINIPEVPVTSVNGMTGDVEVAGVGIAGTGKNAEVFNGGGQTRASGDNSHAEGYATKAEGWGAHAEGYFARAEGQGAHAEGNAFAYGNYSHAEGIGADETVCEFEGEANATVYNILSSYLGFPDKERGVYFFYNGKIVNIVASDDKTFTVDETLSENAIEYGELKGISSIAFGNGSHTEGSYTKAFGIDAHAEGFLSEAQGNWSHAEGYSTIAASETQHVQGEYNIIDAENKYAHIVGNGTAAESSNAHTLDWDGNAWFQGDVFVGGTSQDDADRLVRLSEIGGLGGSGSSAQSDWNQNDESALDYIKNKPFYTLEEGWEIVWDGNISNQDNVVSTGNAENILYYVSETVPSEEELKKAILTVTQNGESSSVELSSVWDNMVTITEDLIEIGGAAIIIKKDNVIYMDTITFPKAGIYFASMQSTTYVSRLEKDSNIKKIEPKYLPIIYSIDDLEAGVSPLETGTLYFVYE